ncbi:MAG: biotin/lipoate A/B protein ligase family protein [Crocosphaera sp.]
MTIRKVWRFIPPIEALGSRQMTIDRWLFTQHENGLTPPVLRFYTWSKPTISLGYLQKKYPDYWDNLIWKKEPLDIVIRPTGGRAVLHQGDLTYMVVMSLDNRQTLAIYQDICTFLIQGWKILGIPLQYGTAKRGYIHNSSCFNTATIADLITAEGSKLMGSAQRRGKRSILQHGSMVLSTDKALFEMIFNQVAPWNLTLMEQLSTDYSREDIIRILSKAAEQHFKIELKTEPLSEEEWKAIIAMEN